MSHSTMTIPALYDYAKNVLNIDIFQNLNVRGENHRSRRDLCQPHAAQKFLTVIRDLESGAVLYIGDGKGIAALDGSLKILKKSKIQAVAMDMSNAYSNWFQTHFPDVKFVFDHFHVIKSMNE